MFGDHDNSGFGFVLPLPESSWGKPPFFPKQGQHPRVLFTADDLPAIWVNQTHTENRFAHRRIMDLVKTPTDGFLTVPTPGTHNMDHGMLAVIEAKAFMYALTNDTSLAREAVHGIINYITTLDIPDGTYPDSCRAFGYVMYIAGCVYDWCYNALTAEEKAGIVAGCENLLAPHLEIGMPPAGQGSLVGHGTEAQLLRDWLTLGIAAYDEYPDIYDYVAGRIFHDYKPSADEYLRSGSHWQGCAYGPYRLYFLLFAQHLFLRMTKGQCTLFSPRLQDATRASLQILRPDGQALRIGDDFNEYGKEYELVCYYVQAFFAACFYRDPVLKGYAKKGLLDFSFFTYSNNALSPVMFLILNQTGISCAGLEQLPTAVYFDAPLGGCVARTAWNDQDASMIYMKIGESNTANHEHKDAGSFQIYSRGILASGSGTYDGYFTPHDITYNKQTISANSLLIINPAMRHNGRWIYSGGQTVEGNINDEHQTLTSWQASAAYRQASVLAHAVNDSSCYLCGNITNAYDAQTVKKVVRHMLSVFTHDKNHPVVFAVYDDIVSVEATFRKVFLLHCQQEPCVTPEGFAIIENTSRGNHGRLVVQSCGEETEMTLVKGCQVNGEEPPLQRSYAADSVCEIGWGRIELSPKRPANQNRLLTLMYAGDANQQEKPIRAVPIHSEKLDGAALLGHTLLFNRDDQPLQESVTFTCAGEGNIRVLLCGAAACTWHILRNGSEVGTANVKREEQLLTFTIQAGTITLIPTSNSQD